LKKKSSGEASDDGRNRVLQNCIGPFMGTTVAPGGGARRGQVEWGGIKKAKGKVKGRPIDQGSFTSGGSVIRSRNWGEWEFWHQAGLSRTSST